MLRDVMETGANDVYIVDRVDARKFCFLRYMTVFLMWMLKKYHDCTFDERACLMNYHVLTCSGNDRERNEHKYYRPCHYKGTVITGSD